MTSVTCSPAATRARSVSPLTCPSRTCTSSRGPAGSAVALPAADADADEVDAGVEEPPPTAGAAAPAQALRPPARARHTRAAGSRDGRTVTGRELLRRAVSGRRDRCRPGWSPAG